VLQGLELNYVYGGAGSDVRGGILVPSVDFGI